MTSAPEFYTRDRRWMSAKGGWEVFVSHSPDTQWNFVEGLAEHELAGCRVSYSGHEHGPRRETWSTTLAALLQARLVVVVLSPRSQRSAWCMEELRAAMLHPERVSVVFYNAEAQRNEAALQEALEEFDMTPQLYHDAPADVLSSWRQSLAATIGPQSLELRP